MGKIVLGRDQQPGGVLVDPMYDAGPPLPADTGESVPTVKEQGVHQGPVRVAGGRMDHHAPGLVDDDHIAVFKDHIQGQILRKQRELFRCGQRHIKAVPRDAAVILPHGGPVHTHKAAFQQALGLAAGQTLYIARKESVDPVAALLCCDQKLIFFHSII